MGYIPGKTGKYVAKIGAVFGQKSQLLWDIPPIDAFYLNKAITPFRTGNSSGSWRTWWNCWI